MLYIGLWRNLINMEKLKIVINNVKYNLYIPENKDKIKDIIIVCQGFITKDYKNKINNVVDEFVRNNYIVVCFNFIKLSKYKKIYKEKLCLYDFEEKLNLIYNFIKEKYPKYKLNIYSIGFGAYICLSCILDFSLNFEKILLNTPAINMSEIFKRKLGKQSLVDLYKINPKRLSKEKMEEITDFYNELVVKDLLKSNKIIKNVLILHEKNNVIPIEDSIFYVDKKCNNSKVLKIDLNSSLNEILINQLDNKW